MIIKNINIEKSRTIKIDGMRGRDAYNKIVIGLQAEVSDGDMPMESLSDLSLLVDKAIDLEVVKINKRAK